MKRPAFNDDLRAGIAKAIRNQGVRSQVIDTAMRKWEQGGNPERCIEELKGKPNGLETGCKCTGCLEALCFVMFSQVARRLADQ